MRDEIHSKKIANTRYKLNSIIICINRKYSANILLNIFHSLLQIEIRAKRALSRPKFSFITVSC